MSELDDFEQRLRHDLRRVDAPAGFAGRVMGRVAAEAAERREVRPISRSRRFVPWMAVAAMLLVGLVLGGWQWRQRQLREQQQARVARQQFQLAMQVTARTLVEVQEQIGHAGEVSTTGRKREVEQ